jgi:chaperonin GroEL (HSP60 family)
MCSSKATRLDQNQSTAPKRASIQAKSACVQSADVLADGVRNVVAGASAIDRKRGLDRAARATMAALHAMARPVKTKAEKAQVATISAHNDPSIGGLVADTLEKVDSEGVISENPALVEFRKRELPPPH